MKHLETNLEAARYKRFIDLQHVVMHCIQNKIKLPYQDLYPELSFAQHSSIFLLQRIIKNGLWPTLLMKNYVLLFIVYALLTFRCLVHHPQKELQLGNKQNSEISFFVSLHEFITISTYYHGCGRCSHTQF